MYCEVIFHLGVGSKVSANYKNQAESKSSLEIFFFFFFFFLATNKTFCHHYKGLHFKQILGLGTHIHQFV